MKWAIRSGLLALFAVFLTGSVKADTILSYSLAGPGTAVTFSLPEFPSSLASFSPDVLDGLFSVAPSNLIINGSPSTDIIAFFNSAGGGALEDATDPSAFNLAGPQLYAGVPDESNPQMLLGTGTFPLLDFETLTIPYTLKVTESSTGPVSTPEPSSLLLLFTGLFALVLLRKRGTAN
jgi:hypothetical protein